MTTSVTNGTSPISTIVVLVSQTAEAGIAQMITLKTGEISLKHHNQLILIAGLLLALSISFPAQGKHGGVEASGDQLRPVFHTSQDKASAGREGSQPQTRNAEEAYKNIQIFKGLPATGVMRAMSFFTTSLGVDCNHCHVAGEFEKDDKPAKQTARKMYEMVQLSNKFLSSNRVSCYGCHRGHVKPEPPPEAWKAELDEMRRKAEQDQRPAEQVYKNVQTLKGLPAGRWTMLMTMFSRSLGVDCTYCHVPNEFEKDDKPAKLIARKMLGLTGAIAREIYKGPTSINCYTCHQGKAQPVSFPPTPAGSSAKPAEPKPPEITRSGPLPSASQVIESYQKAIGGTAAFAKLTTRVLKGSLKADSGFTAPLEVYVKAPDKLLMVMHTPGGGATVAFNGKAAWQKNENGLREMTGAEAEFLKRQAQSFAGAGLDARLSNLEVKGKAKLGERDTYVIDATPAPIRMYFDVQTGLLLRQEEEVDAPEGKTKLIVEFEDYRELDGVKLPFSRRWTRPGFSFTHKFDEIKHNVPIDDSKFEKQ
ncbi:MAG TPA: photosynthetic reaction center cytochrome c subunit family protein [Blastocatellia bacterium]|nr:photosynthetic reaction center cytochrome c subunit family protein [Blastocatellia bacterium]